MWVLAKHVGAGVGVAKVGIVAKGARLSHDFLGYGKQANVVKLGAKADLERAQRRFPAGERQGLREGAHADAVPAGRICAQRRAHRHAAKAVHEPGASGRPSREISLARVCWCAASGSSESSNETSMLRRAPSIADL